MRQTIQARRNRTLGSPLRKEFPSRGEDGFGADPSKALKITTSVAKAERVAAIEAGAAGKVQADDPGTRAIGIIRSPCTMVGGPEHCHHR